MDSRVRTTEKRLPTIKDYPKLVELIDRREHNLWEDNNINPQPTLFDVVNN